MYLTPSYRNNVAPLFDQLDRLFENAFASHANSYGHGGALNLYAIEDRYVATIEAPGFTKEAFDIEVESSVVKVQAELKASEDGTQAERALSRAFKVSDEVDTSRISASYENGILKIDLPKQPAAVAKKITIN